MKLIQQSFFIFLIALNAQIRSCADPSSIHPSREALRLMQQQAQLDAMIIRLLKKATQRPDMAICKHVNDLSGYGKISTERIVESGNFIIEQKIPVVLQVLEDNNATHFGVAYNAEESEIAVTILSKEEVKDTSLQCKPLVSIAKPLMKG